MYPQTRKYFVILVHYGKPTTTNQAVNTLINCQLPPDHIVVIDHALQPYTSKASGNNQLIRPQRNTGYAGGINVGLGALTAHHLADDDIIVAMNNDVSVYPNTFLELRRWWQDHPGDALLGVTSSHINLRTGRTYPQQPAHQPHHLNYLDGAFLAAPYRVFMKTKGIPCHYFMYWEDALFSTQIKRLGISLQVVPTLPLKHASTSASRQPNKLYYLVRNGALFLEQETSLPWRLYWYVANRARLVYHTIRRHRPPEIRQALLDAIRGVTGPRPKSPPGASREPSRCGRQASASERGISEANDFVPGGQKNHTTGAIVVTFRTPKKMLQNCLDSLRANNIKDVSIIHNTNTNNPGFATAANKAATRLSNHYLLFINPDATLAPNALAVAQRYLEQHSSVGIVGFLLHSPGGRVESLSFGAPVNPLSLITRHFSKTRIPQHPTPVGWVSGGAFIIRRNLFRQLGGFDPRFFLYWEDVDLCRRALEAGWQVILHPQARAIHQRGASLSNNQYKTKLYDQSADKYFCKHYPNMICFFVRFSRSVYRLFSPLSL